MPSPCGGACGCPTPTFETPAIGQPSSSNKTGPTTIEPTDTLPAGPPAPIKQRSGPGPAPEGSKFERQPQGSLDTSDGLNPSQASTEPAGLIEKRFFRQCASAGFHTRVLVPGPEQLISQADRVGNTAPADFVLPHAVARTD